MNLVILDTNVILDFVLKRQPWHAAAAALWRAHLQGRLSAHVTASSLTDVFYVVPRMASAQDALSAVHSIAATLIVIAMDYQSVLDALALPGADFEDNLQIACAKAAGLDLIVTRDPAGFRDSPVPVLSPDDALVRLAAPRTDDPR